MYSGQLEKKSLALVSLMSVLSQVSALCTVPEVPQALSSPDEVNPTAPIPIPRNTFRRLNNSLATCLANRSAAVSLPT